MPHEQREIIFVTERPSALGAPLPPDAWRLFRGACTHAGLDPDQAGYDSATRVPAGVAITHADIDGARPALLDRLRARGPRLVVALGSAAAESLLGRRDLKLRAIRGTTFELDGADGTGWVVLPTLNPIAVIKSASEFRRFQADLDYAGRLMRGGTPKRCGDTEYVIATEETIARIVTDLRQRPLLAADIETTGLNPRTDRILCLGITFAVNKAVIIPAALLPRAAWLFSAEGVRWVWHNGKFDTAFLQELGIPARVDEDTMLMHYALNETSGGHGLKELATEQLGAPEYVDAIKPYLKQKIETGRSILRIEEEDGTVVEHEVIETRPATYEDIPTDLLYGYLAKDCDYTYQLYRVFDARLSRQPDLYEMYRSILIPASGFLQRVERTGMLIDRQALDALRIKYTAAAATAREQLITVADRWWDPERYRLDTKAKTAPERFNPASSQQLTWLLYSRLQLEPGPHRKQDTQKLTLKTLNHPLVDALLAYREASKALATYVDGIERNIEADGRVRTTYLIHGTTTGRLSSREPNLQNIPQDKAVRAMFVAPPGRTLIEADFAAHELRCLAHLSGDPTLTAILEEGRDLHTEVCKSIFHIDESAADWKRRRTIAKSVTFGIMYGRTAHGLAKGIDVTLEEGNAMIAGWARQFPDAWAFLQACRAKPLAGEPVISPLGRRRRFPLITQENKQGVQNEASNFPIQSLSSDLTLLSAMAMEDALGRLGGRIINLVHDSIMIEIPDHPAVIAQAAQLVLATMRETPNRVINARVQFEAEVSVGPSWGAVKEWEEADAEGEVAA